MTDSLLVIFEDTIVGTVVRLQRGTLRFEYNDEYRERPNATPLSLSMPIQSRSHTDGVITPWLWNLLPDNNAVLERWARQFQVSLSSPFSLLATQIGDDCAGAVRFMSPEKINRVLPSSGDVTWLTEDGVAQRLRELRADSTSWLGDSFTGQFSLAGAQAKTALMFKDGCWGVPSGSSATTHILKPAVAGFDDHEINEHLCLDAARRVGLLAVRTSLIRFGEEYAVVVDRYDRLLNGEEILRVHQEDLCQALGIPPSRKYQNEGGPGPAEIAKFLRQVMPFRIGEDAVGRFADALIWNWIIAGTDAHAKNYSLLLADGQVRLAPMYDVASALPYDVHLRKLRFAMKVGDDYRVFLYHNPWPSAARDLGLDVDSLVFRVRELATLAPDAFSEAVKNPDVEALGRPMPALLVDLIKDRADHCLRLIDAD